MPNSVNPDRTAPFLAVLSGSALRMALLRIFTVLVLKDVLVKAIYSRTLMA